MIAGNKPPSKESDQSAISLEQASPKDFNDHAVTVNEKIQTEEVSESRIPEAEKAAKTLGEQNEVKLPQNSGNTKTVECGSITIGANIRSDASLTSEVLRTVPSGYPIEVLEKKGNWFLVDDYRGRKGWVYASLVTKPSTVIIKVFKGNLRSGPSLKDDVIVQLDHGEIMSVLERKGDWLKVSNNKELTGWLYQQVVWPTIEIDE